MKDCQNDNIALLNKEKNAVWEVCKVEASNVFKTHRVAKGQLIGGLDRDDESLAQTGTLDFVPFSGFSHVGLNYRQLFEDVHQPDVGATG